MHFTTADIALMSIFCALWVVLNYTLGPLSFQLLRLPVLHDFAAFFTLLLVTWVVGKFGTASFVGVVGAIIVLLAGGPLPNAGFAVAALLFDTLMITNHHKIRLKAYNMAVVTVATLVSAYVAGVLIGVFIMNMSLEWSLTFWGGWHLIGGAISVAVTLPIISVLEKTGAKRIRVA